MNSNGLDHERSKRVECSLRDLSITCSYFQKLFLMKGLVPKNGQFLGKVCPFWATLDSVGPPYLVPVEILKSSSPQTPAPPYIDEFNQGKGVIPANLPRTYNLFWKLHRLPWVDFLMQAGPDCILLSLQVVASHLTQREFYHFSMQSGPACIIQS